MPKGVTKREIMAEAHRRRDRLRDYISRDPPLSVSRIAQIEGMNHKAVLDMLNDIGKEGKEYLKLGIRSPKDELPFGLTEATGNLRRKLGDLVFMVRERGDHAGPVSLSPRIGLNFHEQKKAIERPFNHDWKLSQIERLAQELGRDPREVLMSCLNA